MKYHLEIIVAIISISFAKKYRPVGHFKEHDFTY